MKRRTRETNPGFWPGVSDALLGALMMVLLLALGGLMIFAMRPKPALPVDMTAYLQDKVDKLEKLLAELRKENEQLKQEVDLLKAGNLAKKVADLLIENKRLKEEIEVLKAENERLGQESKSLRKKAPPIIELTDVASISFDPGSAEISSEFKERLKLIYFPQFLSILNEYEVVDTIEIIGHTDRSSVSSESTLDRDLNPVILGSKSADAISPGSNADLGLMRSLAVMQEWKKWLASRQVSERIHSVGIRTYSAAYAVLPGSPPEKSETTEGKKKSETFDKMSRRIEVRFTRLKPQ